MPAKPSLIDVLLVEDHSVVRTGLKRVLEDAEDIRVVGEAATGLEGIHAFTEKNPDVVIVDISIPEMDGLEVIKQIRALNSEAKVLVLTMYPEESYAVRALRAGCLGYLTKSVSAQQLREAVRTVAGGKRYLSERGWDIAGFQLLLNSSPHGATESLSDREMQVLILVARGLKLNEIADELSLSKRTIETYRTRLLRKLRLRNNADISRYAVQNGLA